MRRELDDTRINRRASDLWIERGRPGGEVGFWEEAIAQIEAEDVEPGDEAAANRGG